MHFPIRFPHMEHIGKQILFKRIRPAITIVRQIRTFYKSLEMVLLMEVAVQVQSRVAKHDSNSEQKFDL